MVIVNHHLLCADAAVRHGSFGEVIPGCPTLVVDEAHQLEDVATNYFGVAFSNYRVDELVRDGERLLAGAHAGTAATTTGSGHAGTSSTWRGRWLAWPSTPGGFSPRSAGHAPWTPRRTEARVRYTAASLLEPLESGLSLAGALEGLEATVALAQQATLTPDPDRSAQAETLGRRAGELHDGPAPAAAGRRSRSRLRAGDPWARRVPAGVAGGRVAARARGRVRSLPHGGPDLGDARRGRLVRLREGPAGHPRWRTICACRRSSTTAGRR